MSNQTKNWCPAIELNETAENLVLKAEVPGVEIEHLNIHAETDSISISGIHDHHASTTEKELIPSQLHYGSLQCNVPLPVNIVVKETKAELIGGVLTVTMPKVAAVGAVRL